MPCEQHTWTPAARTQHLRVVVLLVLCLVSNLYFCTFWAHVLGGEGLSLTLLLVADVSGVRGARRVAYGRPPTSTPCPFAGDRRRTCSSCRGCAHVAPCAVAPSPSPPPPLPPSGLPAASARGRGRAPSCCGNALLRPVAACVPVHACAPAGNHRNRGSTHPCPVRHPGVRPPARGRVGVPHHGGVFGGVPV